MAAAVTLRISSLFPDFEMSPMRTRLKMNLMRKFGRHLDVPRGSGSGEGGGGAEAALVRGRRPSIAPVPAMFGQEDSSEDEDEEEQEQVEEETKEELKKEEEEEKYLEIQWVTPAENCE